MPQVQAFRQGSDVGLGLAGFHGQQQLMLRGLQACAAGRLLAEMEKAADLVAEFG